MHRAGLIIGLALIGLVGCESPSLRQDSSVGFAGQLGYSGSSVPPGSIYRSADAGGVWARDMGERCRRIHDERPCPVILMH